MARMNGAYLAAGIVDGVVEVVVLHAGQSEDRVDAVGEKALDECFASGANGAHRAALREREG